LSAADSGDPTSFFMMTTSSSVSASISASETSPSLFLSSWFSFASLSFSCLKISFSFISSWLASCVIPRVSSMVSRWAFLRSRAVCAATLFFSFLRSIFSSAVRCVSLCRFRGVGAGAVLFCSIMPRVLLTLSDNPVKTILVVVAILHYPVVEFLFCLFRHREEQCSL